MTNGTILVTGGTGKTGAVLAARLREAGVSVRIASRRASAGSDAAVFDWADAATYGSALGGVDRVYLVAPTGDPNPERVMAPFLRRAVDAGVRRAVLLSSSAIPDGGPALGKVHQAVRELTPEWSVLQPSWFMQNFTTGQHGGTIKSGGGIITAAGDGKVGFIDAADIAEAAFYALTDPLPHNKAHILTGPQALSYDEVASVLSDAAGKTIRHVRISRAELIARLTAFGIPPDYAALLADLEEAVQDGVEDRVTGAVEEVTGRAPKSFAAFAQDNAGAW
jgi:ergot alkaloid biosynthesis protein